MRRPWALHMKIAEYPSRHCSYFIHVYLFVFRETIDAFLQILKGY
jgi:hypothetical protein